MTDHLPLPNSVADLVKSALIEDIGSGDVTTSLTIPKDLTGAARVVARSPLTVSGLTPFRLSFELLDPTIEIKCLVSDGATVAAKTALASLTGPAATILTAERAALNFLGHLSGIATTTKALAEKIGPHGAKLLDTRKTTPGLRILEKAAVRHGGGHNHRVGLFDGILIKDNHIQAAGSISSAIERARAKAPHLLKIEVEVETLEELALAIEAKADAILLDNMTPEQLKTAVLAARKQAKSQGRQIILEASGGINIHNAAEIAQTGVDYLSVGALTHSAPCADIGLDWE
ncbi:MAG: carboxylating nicotinate-nucleotide diphosphorylase [Deltaproteobacteria bacterium]|nr:carboxylating nicotinate-nucleotide diphosphorylase [Deltaproteobacteria bacterium]